MYAQFYAGSRLIDLPLFALLLFVATFVAVLVRTSVAKRRGDFESVARVPLDDGQPAPHAPQHSPDGRPVR